MSTDDRVRSRAQKESDSADPLAQAEAILEESDIRQVDRNAAPDTVLEKRRSEETVDPT